MMINTKHVKVEFGRIAHSQYNQQTEQSTQGVGLGRVEIIKMIQKGNDESTFSGYRKVNYTDRKMKEAYQKINRMLGGD